MEFSENKKRLIKSIKRKPLDRVPMMYRALPGVNDRMMSYFSLESDINNNWQELKKLLNIDCFSSGAGMGKFTSYRPRYNGSRRINNADGNMFYAWGIESYYDEKGDSISYMDNEETCRMDSIGDLRLFNPPSPEEFDLSEMIPDKKLAHDNMMGAGTLNSIFMIAMYLRGAGRFLTELMSDKKLAHYYIDMIGEFALELNRAILEKIGKEMDYYRLWDDMAMQGNMMIPHDIFMEFFYPWYRKLFEDAKKYGLINFFHICGNANDIVRDLIEIGVDILDPVQVSAKDMDLARLKKEYGKHITFHGGIDVQGFLQNASVHEITGYVREVHDMFMASGGLILGPSHEITPDTPTENILAVYRPDLL